jgi:methylated-DNA-[protein]-cysteine S-methyltransferase
MPSLTIPSPYGPLTLTEKAAILTSLDWRAGHDDPSDLLIEAAAQLTAYFNKTLHTFTLPMDYGTGIHEGTRRAMATIPYGETRTYGDIARELHTNAQAVGQACGANPLPILIPCHRVVGAQNLGGFSAKGGVETKVALLRHEGAASLLI